MLSPNSHYLHCVVLGWFTAFKSLWHAPHTTRHPSVTPCASVPFLAKAHTDHFTSVTSSVVGSEVSSLRALSAPQCYPHRIVLNNNCALAMLCQTGFNYSWGELLNTNKNKEPKNLPFFIPTSDQLLMLISLFCAVPHMCSGSPESNTMLLWSLLHEALVMWILHLHQ